MLHDFNALNKIELMPWDLWTDLFTKTERELGKEDQKLLDQVADLTVRPDNIDEIRELYERLPYNHAQKINSRMILLGLSGNMKMTDPSELHHKNQDILSAYQTQKTETADTKGLKLPELSQTQGDTIGDPGELVIRGARQNNLKNVDINIPRNKLVVITGVSGSGKSTLAFDTIYAEGRRRYMEGFSSSARQFMEVMEKPEVDQIHGLNPPIAIEQKTVSQNPRSTVGSLTDVADYLRVLFTQVGTFYCPQCGTAIQPQNVSQVVRLLASLDQGTSFKILAPVVRNQLGAHSERIKKIQRDGYKLIRDNKKFIDVSDKMPGLDKNISHTIEIVIGEFAVPENDIQLISKFQTDLQYSVDTAFNTGDGILVVILKNGEEITYSKRNICTNCDLLFPSLTPAMFNHNRHEGACQECNGLGVKLSVDPELIVTKPYLSILDGSSPWWGVLRGKKKTGNWMVGELYALAEYYKVDLDLPWDKLPEEFRKAVLLGTGDKEYSFSYVSNGRVTEIVRPALGAVTNINRLFRETKSEASRLTYMQFMREQNCEVCQGERLSIDARFVTVGGKRMPEVTSIPISQVYEWILSLNEKLNPVQMEIAGGIIKELSTRLQFIINVGLHYLSLDRAAPTLSGGEGQRIRLATQMGCNLVGLLYVLDEPSIGLHPKDHKALINTLVKLRDAGNSVLVVEHDEDTMKAADWLIDIGPGAGVLGGRVISSGTPQSVMDDPNSLTGKYLSGKLQVSQPNLERRKPKGWLTLSGASVNNLNNLTVQFPLGVMSCVTGVSGSGKSSLVTRTLAPALDRLLNGAQTFPGPYEQLDGLEQIDKMINIDQTPIGRSPRSNPATYVEVFEEIRKLFASLPEAKTRGFKHDRFSFNSSGGRCEACEGYGKKRVEMQFMPDVWVTCTECNGKRYNPQTLGVKYKGKTISDVLEMDVLEALELFSGQPNIVRILGTLRDVGLDYIKLGQSALTLSGGEAQRVKLAKELCRSDTGKTIYILDEPTTGLHFADIQKLLNVLQQLVNIGNTIIIIEHNIDVMRAADWIVDIGPEGGDGGGHVVAVGTPEEVSTVEESYTGHFLKNH
jgi:excinuclease ABC subunit A